MTNYYIRTFRALDDFIQIILKLSPSNDEKASATVIDNWMKPIKDLVGSDDNDPTKKTKFYRKIHDLKIAKENLGKKKGGIRSGRLGLRAAGINPRGPYGFTKLEHSRDMTADDDNDANMGPRQKYRKAFGDVKHTVEQILDKIQGTKRSGSDPTLLKVQDALAQLLDHFEGKEIPTSVYQQVKSFAADLSTHIKRTGTVEKIEPDPNSSYWPSSFIASSSSSSSLPPSTAYP